MTAEAGRWSDLVDLAHVHRGRGYPTWGQIDYLLWERTPYPLGTPRQIWDAVLAVLDDALLVELVEAIGWVDRQETPAPDWDGLLARSLDALLERGKRIAALEQALDERKDPRP